MDIFRTTFGSNAEHEEFLGQLTVAQTSLRCVGNELKKSYPDAKLSVECGIELTIDHPELNSDATTTGEHLAKSPWLQALAKQFNATFDGWDEDGFALIVAK